jgi:hypothetical protein
MPWLVVTSEPGREPIPAEYPSEQEALEAVRGSMLQRVQEEISAMEDAAVLEPRILPIRRLEAMLESGRPEAVRRALDRLNDYARRARLATVTIEFARPEGWRMLGDAGTGREDDGVMMARDPGGQYFAVRRREWESDADPVHVWMGPLKPETKISRGFLEEVECPGLREDAEGFWDCPPTADEIRDDVLRKAETVIENLANDNAASAWSTPSDDMIEEFGDVYVVANFGDSVAVNGEISMPGEARALRGWEQTDRGGRVPSTEEEVEVETVADIVARDLSYDMKRKIPKELVEDILRDEHGDRDHISWTVSGETEVYAPPEGMREQASRERGVRFRPPPRRPSPKVWSPRKRKP